MHAVALSLTEGLVLGLAAGASCLGWCLPALGPYVATSAQSGRAGLRAVLVFNAGRLSGYLAILLLSLAAGAALSDRGWLRPLSACALVLLGGVMLLHALRAGFPGSSLCRLQAVSRLLDRFPGAAGLLIGLSPCPPLLLAAAAIVGRSPAKGLLFAGAFFVATSLFLLPMALLAHARVRPIVSGLGAAAALLAAPWFIAHGVALLAAPGVH